MLMIPDWVVVVHLFTILPAASLGAWLFLAKKGSPLHRKLGKIYMVLMGFTALWTLFLPAHVGPTLFGHFGGLHALSLLTAWTVPTAWKAARNGQIRKHKSAMIQLYVGGILVAGGFALFSEGRLLHTMLFSE